MTETAQDQWTIKRLLEWTTDFFAKSATGNARLEAEVLLSEALQCQRIMLYTRFDEIPDDQTLTKFRAWVKRRGAGEPVAYIVGYREFYSLKFSVDSNVLIPRPETEHVVVAALECAKELQSQTVRIIDVGTGSGCIAVTLATQIANCKIAATDISEAALTLAKTNAAEHSVDDRVHFFQGDLFDALPAGSEPVHVVVSNPPYIGTEEVGTVDEQVAEHEPSMALYSGTDGLDVTRRLIDEAPKFLLPGGTLILESSPIVMNQVVAICKQSETFESVTVQKDLAGHERILIARTKP